MKFRNPRHYFFLGLPELEQLDEDLHRFSTVARRSRIFVFARQQATRSVAFSTPGVQSWFERICHDTLRSIQFLRSEHKVF